jgi:hypothetical protein
MNTKAKIEAALTLAKLSAVRDVLQTITSDADAKQAGTKAHLLAFLLGCSPCATQKEAASRLGISPARFCQMLAVFKRQYRVSR